jgi:hypothetical protein
MVSNAACEPIETSHSAVIISDGPSHGFILGDVGRKDARTPEKFSSFIVEATS